MRILSRIGWFCLGIGLLLIGIVFFHYGGLEKFTPALFHMLATAFWGGIIWAGLFLGLIAILFLSA